MTKHVVVLLQPGAADWEMGPVLPVLKEYFGAAIRTASPDGKTIFVATDPGGLAESSSGGTTTKMEDPGAILAFTYMGEGSGKVISQSKPGAAAPAAAASKEDRGPLLTRGFPPQFTAAQAAAGRTSYNERCAVCHGSNMNGCPAVCPLECFSTFSKNE